MGVGDVEPAAAIFGVDRHPAAAERDRGAAGQRDALLIGVGAGPGAAPVEARGVVVHQDHVPVLQRDDAVRHRLDGLALEVRGDERRGTDARVLGDPRDLVVQATGRELGHQDRQEVIAGRVRARARSRRLGDPLRGLLQPDDVGLVGRDDLGDRPSPGREVGEDSGAVDLRDRPHERSRLLLRRQAGDLQGRVEARPEVEVVGHEGEVALRPGVGAAGHGRQQGEPQHDDEQRADRGVCPHRDLRVRPVSRVSMKHLRGPPCQRQRASPRVTPSARPLVATPRGS